jgi:hypothetical protein
VGFGTMRQNHGARPEWERRGCCVPQIGWWVAAPKGWLAETFKMASLAALSRWPCLRPDSS